jgi:hypothetical protein
MALAPAFIDAHIHKWETALKSAFYPYRQKWPSRLFHHAPIENALKILTDGHLRSRADPKNQRTKDVAAAGVIAASPLWSFIDRPTSLRPPSQHRAFPFQ